jgi:iron complex outermembrane receptor protein
MKNSKNLATALLSGAGALALFDISAQAAEPTEVEEVVVTGSRVISNGNASPTPVTVISTQDALRIQPGTLFDSLQILPVFSGSHGAGSAPGATGGVSGGNGASNQLNLRNIGILRTLVLMDGKRIPPTLFSGLVDVDMIPQMMISRVDVVTGGVSAVYGSDAIAGVVNYIVDRNFTGVRTELEGGQSDRGDGERLRAGLAFGTNLFGGRGHFEGSYEYQHDVGVDRRSDREWMQQWGITGAGTVTAPYVNQSNVRLWQTPAGGMILGGVLNEKTFNPDGTVRQFVHGQATGTQALEIGGDGGYWDSTLLAPLEFNQIFGRFDFDFAPKLHGYAQLGGNLKTNTQYLDNVQLQSVQMNSQNAFLNPTYRAQLAAAGETTFRLNEIMMGGPRFGSVAETDMWTLTTGLEGGIGRYKWVADYSYGNSVLKNTQLDNLNRQNLAAALDAVAGPGGTIVCNITLTNPNSGCVPLNAFGVGAPSQAAIDYIQQDTHYKAKTIQHDVTAGIAGALFNTWAGPVNAALSAEWRKLSFSADSEYGPTDYANCTGLRYNCTAGTTLIYNYTFATQPTVSNTVWEGAFEADVPLVLDAPLIESFNLNGAVRYTSYETSGNYTTWKLGFDWHLNDALRFRGTRSRDIRAPNLNDLFGATFFGGSAAATDLLTNQSPRLASSNGSNPELTAEIGDTTSVGVVWRPFNRLSVTVDAYHIKVRDAIVSLQAVNPVLQRACYASGGTSRYCLLQSRPNGFTDTSPANAVTAWRNIPINISELETYGADLEVNYAATVFERQLNLRLLSSWQPHLWSRQPELDDVDLAGAAFGPSGQSPVPRVRLTALARLGITDRLSVDLMHRWRSELLISGVRSEVWLNNELDTFSTTNLAVTYRPSGTYIPEMYVNVQNVFDNAPQGSGYNGNGLRAGFRDGYPTGDNPMGRFYTLGLRLKF